jgi:hypothetical protein
VTVVDLVAANPELLTSGPVPLILVYVAWQLHVLNRNLAASRLADAMAHAAIAAKLGIELPVPQPTT